MNWQDLADRELVELCLQGDQQAWKEFLRRFQRVIAGVVVNTIRNIHFQMLSDRSLIEDLVEETLLKLCNRDFRALRTFQWQHENSFRGFLKVTSSNVVRDHFRKNHRVDESLDSDDPGAMPVVTHSPATDTGILVQKLVACLERLLSAEADVKRNVAIFLLYYQRGLTAKEISQVYSLTIKAVENTLLRLVRIAKARCLHNDLRP